MPCLVMFLSVVLLMKIFKTVLAFLTTSSGAPDLLYGCLLGKVTNLATYRPNIKLNLAIQALGKLRPTFLGDLSNPS